MILTHRIDTVFRHIGFEARRAPIAIRAVVNRYVCGLVHRSHAVARFLDSRMTAIGVAWLVIFALASMSRLLFPVTPVASIRGLLILVLPYALIAAAPLAGFMIAAGSFPRGVLTAQPQIRLALFGQWRGLDVLEARRNAVYGPAGFMASLLVGLLLNVVVRSFEFLLAMPAMGASAPQWADRLFWLMATDVIVMSFFYMVCFVLALRSNPLFPRMLLFAWSADVAMQFTIARSVMQTAGVPDTVSVPLHGLLEGNVTKVLISALVWLPYLILSNRVNVTYRCRIAAS